MERPLVIFDLETTGTDISEDRIVQIGVIKVNTDGTTISKKSLVNPGRAIPKEATEVHKITDAMVYEAPKFKQISSSFHAFIQDCDVAGYNSNQFDVPLLMEEFERVGITWDLSKVSLVDVLEIERKLNSHKLGETYKRYTGKELEGAHDALADVAATRDILVHQILEIRKLLKKNSLSLVELTNFIQADGPRKFDLAGKMIIDEGGVVRWTFGKYKGKNIKTYPDYAKWFLSGSFPTESKAKLKEHFSTGALKLI